MRIRATLFFLLLLVSAPVTLLLAQGAHWYTPLNFGLIPMMPTAGRYDDIFFISHDTGVLVSSYGMIFKTYDGAEHWTLKKAVSPSAYFRSVEFSADGQTGIAGTLTGQVFRSADRGETWDDISTSIRDTSVYSGLICGLSHVGNIFYGVGYWGGTQAHFYKSLDAGVSWGVTYLDTTLVTGLVDIVFLSENKGFVSGCRNYTGSSGLESVVLRTLDGGNTWTKVFSDTTIGGRIWKLQFVDSEFAVGSIEPIYRDTVAMIRSTDGGNTWQIHGAGTVNAWTTGWGTQGIGFLNRQKGWLGGYYNGMFETNDGGITWDTLNINEECDRFFLIDSTFYVSANTVYKYGSSDPPTKVNNPTAPEFLHKLYPVVPNPASGIVSIAFDINAHQTNTVLEVVNIDGRKTYPIMHGPLKPGHYEYTWDGTREPAGNYIIWLGTDEIPMVERFTVDHR